MSNISNKVVYIGVTNDLKRRVYEHKKKLIPGFSNRYNLTKLVYYEYYNHIDYAILREKRLKKWKRAWKDNLINDLNPDWRDLYDDVKEW